jgi:glycosyltransferase involved in cell wall biosynthesis
MLCQFPNETAGTLNIKMLLTDGYGGIGGIAKFNRDFLQALNRCPHVRLVHALPRLIQNPIEEAIPRAIVYEQRSARGKAAFMARVGAHALRRDGTNVVICGHINLLPAAVPLARLHRSRLTLIIHGVDAWTPTPRPLVNRLVRHVDDVISVSRHSAELFARWSKVPLERAYILPNCVDLDSFEPQQPDMNLVRRYGFQGCRVILTVGRLSSLEQCKGFDETIELMPRLLRRYPNLRYLIVGEGDDRSRLEAKAESLAPGKVLFAGHVPESEKVAHYNLADAYVMPSRGEGFGIVLIEAAACGVPVIGSSVDGSREALLEGKLGRLVDPMDQGMLFDAICAALDERTENPSDQARTRPDLSTYSVDKFRSRVADWCRRQTVRLQAA